MIKNSINFILLLIFCLSSYWLVCLITPIVLQFKWWQIIFLLLYISLFIQTASFLNSQRFKKYIYISKKQWIFIGVCVVILFFSLIEPWKKGISHFSFRTWIFAVLFSYSIFLPFYECILIIISSSIIKERNIYKSSAEMGNLYAKSVYTNTWNFNIGQPEEYIKSSSETFVNILNKAKKGDADAQYSIGLCYYHGIGLMINYIKAIKWFQEAAEQGFSDAQYLLAQCYENGTGVSKNELLAEKWLNIAIMNGFKNEKKALYPN